MDLINSIISAVSGFLYEPWCVPLILLAGGIIMTVRSKFIQVRLFTESFKVIMEKPKTSVSLLQYVRVAQARYSGCGLLLLSVVLLLL